MTTWPEGVLTPTSEAKSRTTFGDIRALILGVESQPTNCRGTCRPAAGPRQSRRSGTSACGLNGRVFSLWKTAFFWIVFFQVQGCLDGTRTRIHLLPAS